MQKYKHFRFYCLLSTNSIRVQRKNWHFLFGHNLFIISHILYEMMDIFVGGGDICLIGLTGYLLDWFDEMKITDASLKNNTHREQKQRDTVQ